MKITGMSNRETNAWLTIMIEILKSQGIEWKKLNQFEQGEYLLKWANGISSFRNEIANKLNEDTQIFIAKAQEGAE